MSVAVVLLAAGRGERLGAGIPKALVQVRGKTLLEHSLGEVAQFNPDQIVVVAPADHLVEVTEIASRFSAQIQVISGGATRQNSAAIGVSQVTAEKVLIHDAARALAPASLFRAVSDALSTKVRAVVPGLPVTDTIKQVQGAKNGAARVTETPDRAGLRRIQTPQGFFTEDLKVAYAAATSDFTDDAGLMESRGEMAFVVSGDERAAKVTTPSDLEALANNQVEKNSDSTRAGIGSDAHRFGATGVLKLGCLEWPDFPQLEGHSDGDAMAHAIVDAMLSAAQLGDIGSNFGTDRPEFAAASGQVFLDGALRLLQSAGYELVNVAVQVVADQPKIGPRRDELQGRLSNLLGAPVSVAATTTDGLGFMADARGIGCVATALLRRAG